MNREIIFRGKLTTDNKWVYGCLIEDHKGECMIIDYANHNTDTYAWNSVIPESVGQYTGLKDKNGVKIFEGDVIIHPRQSRPWSSKAKTSLVKCVVVWDDGIPTGAKSNTAMKDNPSLFNRRPEFRANPCNRDSKESSWGYNWSEFHDCEVIGNIFDNVELLNN